MFAFDEAQAERQLHYRTFMMNVVWPPKGGGGYCARTFADLAERAGPMWDEYQVHIDLASAHKPISLAFVHCSASLSACPC